jgi:predicted transglutaminase-like cysteine proteinase
MVRQFLAAVALAALVPFSAAANPTVPAPRGWIQFCKTYSTQCHSEKVAAPISYDKFQKDLHQITIYVNKFQARVETPKEDWYYIDRVGYGDCEDYVLTKRRILHDNYGVSFSNLLIAVVQARNELHAVLIVRTDKGFYVLDNLRNRLVLLDDVGYGLVKLQSPLDSAEFLAADEWKRFDDEIAVATANMIEGKNFYGKTTRTPGR